MERFRIFVSSPNDVSHERRRVDRVVGRLNGEFAGIAHLTAIRWETEFYQAHTTFQAQIPASTECDIVIAIFHGRLGTELPPDFERMADGTSYPSGTAYEVLTAMAARRANPFPDIFVFRDTDPPLVQLDDPQAAQVQDQWQRLKSFFDTWFVTLDGQFTAAFQKFSSTDEFEAQVERLLRGWLSEKVLAGRSVVWPIATKGSPFRGLAAFGAKHASVFFGRDRDIVRGVDRWKDAAAAGTGFLLVVGASGAGKSSLARAGLVPRLIVPGVVAEIDLWRVAVLRPSEVPGGPLLTLATRLLDGAADIPEAESGRPPAIPELATSDYRTPAELAAQLHHADAAAVLPLIRALDRIGEAERTTQGFDRPVRVELVVLIDQLDELFAPDVPAAERAVFAAVLGRLAASGRVWLVATLRADLYERFLAEPALLALKSAGAAYDLAPPGPAELAEIVRQPAAAAELVFETDPASGMRLDERLLAEADRPDMLPLLQLVLNRLFEGRVVVGGETRLTQATYSELGGLAGIIDREAERAIAGLGEAELAALPPLLRRLAAFGHDGGHGAGAEHAGLTIRTVPLAAATPDEPARRLVAALVEARILLTSGAGAEAGISLAHQRVLADWVRARELIAANAEFYRVRDEVEEQRRRWQAVGERAELLLPRGLPLAEAEAIAVRFGGELAPETRAFIAASGRRARRIQHLTAAAAVVLALLAVTATGAGLLAYNQSQRAQTQQAKAESEKTRAEAEKIRATDNEHRANAALLATKRETAQTLAAQVQLALRQNDVRQALALAVQAGNTEKDILGPGERSASEPALLNALAQAREVLHIKGASQNRWLPYGFVDDATLAYADAVAGVVLVDLQQPKIIAHIPFPEPSPASHLAVLPARGLVAVAAGKDLLLIDTRQQRITAAVALPDVINSLDIDPGRHVAVAAVGSAFALIDLDEPQAPRVIEVPGAGETKIGQVRFVRSGAAIALSYGVKLVEYDLAAQSFSEVFGELSGAGMGVDNATLAKVLAEGRIAFVRLIAEFGEANRVFTVAPLELQAIEIGEKRARTLPREDPDLAFLGVAPIDQDHAGRPTATAAVLGRGRDERQELQLRYLSGSQGLILSQDGRLLPPFEDFAVTPGDLAYQKPDTCTVSMQVSFLACQYWSKDLQGIVIWRLLGGAHRFERVAERYNASSALFGGAPAHLLASTDTGLVSIADSVETRLVDLPEDWRLAALEPPFVVALSPTAKQGRIFRRGNADTTLAPVFGPVPAMDIAIVPGTARALVREPDRLSLVEIDGGRALWAVPIASLRNSAVAGDGRRVIAVAAAAVYVLEVDSGRILASFPLALAPDGPAEIDPQGRSVAFLNADKTVVVLDLASGNSRKLPGAEPVVTQLAWSRDGNVLLVGGADGSVRAWDASNALRTLVPSPFAKSFQASAWPGQPPQGVVLQLALSHDGQRFAVIRQDMPTVDIHDLADGRRLTQLTPPSLVLKVPAQVSFAADDAVVSVWAVHAMARGKPRFVMVHRLPRNFDEALAAAASRLAALDAIWSPAGPGALPPAK